VFKGKNQETLVFGLAGLALAGLAWWYTVSQRNAAATAQTASTPKQAVKRGGRRV
jgi:hypothetical protein